MFDYYYGDESEQFSFLMVPRVLFTEKETFGSLSLDAKVLYAFLHERMTVSRENGWLDDNGRVYIIFTIEEIVSVLDCSEPKAVKVLRELDDESGIGLIQKKRRGQGKTAIIYVKNFVRTNTGYTVFPKREVEDVENSVESLSKAVESQGEFSSGLKKDKSLNLKNLSSRTKKTQSQELKKVKSNYINHNQNNLSYTNISQSIPPAQEKAKKRLIDGIDRQAIEKQICEAIEYDYLYTNDDTLRSMVTEMKDIMVDVMCGDRDIYVGGKRIPKEAAKSAYSKLTSEHITTALQSILNYSEPISKIDSFIATVLYNAAFTQNLSTFTGFTAATGIRLIE